MRFENGKKVEEYDQLFSSEDDIPPHVQALTHIYPEDIEGKPTFESSKAAMEKCIGTDTLIVGQNVGFDIGMLKGQGIDLSTRPWIDTSMLASLVFPELESYSLGYISKVLNLHHEPVHRALGDVNATTELLSKCWERLCSLPTEQVKQAKDILGRSSEGYRLLAACLPTKGGILTLSLPTPAPCASVGEERELFTPKIGSVTLHEEDPDPNTLHRILRAAVKDTKTRHWVAVKNLEATIRRCELPEGADILHPPFLLPDENAVKKLLAQETFTSDEATLALKILWFSPKTRADLAVHGGEKEVWAGRIACTDECDAYREQFEKLSSVVIVDQRQFLQFLAHPIAEATAALEKHPHVIIDDASMLEETATKAFGAVCAIQEVRAAAGQDPILIKIADMLSLWTERTRQDQDLRMLAPSDLERPETKQLCAQMSELLSAGTLSAQMRRLFENALMVFDSSKLEGNLVWIEVWQNGNAVLQSFPIHLDKLLQEHLFSRFPTTLLVPPGTKELEQVIPYDTTVTVEELSAPPAFFNVSFPTEKTIDFFLQNPPPGKTVLLLGSRKGIESVFIRFSAPLDDQGITLICQGLGGSQGRMEAEFAAATAPAILVVTPWMYEGFELPADTVDTVVLDQVPFDSPSQPLLQARCKYVSNAFMDYLMPKLEHRLFRVLRTLKRHSKGIANVEVLDPRLRSKDYGKQIMNYVMRFNAGDAPVAKETPAAIKPTAEKKPAKKKAAAKTKKNQPSLF